MNILVTGASGYIGSHVVCELYKQKKHKITGVDIQETRNTKFIKNKCHFIQCDFSKLFGKYDTIIHCAGYIQVEESMQNPDKYYTNNTIKTKTLLKNTEFNNFIFASTAGAFEPISPYAKSKIKAENIIKELCDNYTIFRFFNVAGTNGILSQIGKSTHLIKICAEVAANKKDLLHIYGNNYQTKDGTCIRDYIHVEDLAKSICLAIDFPANTNYECLGSNKGYTNLEVANTMKKVSNNDFEIYFSEKRAGDPAKILMPNVSKYCINTKNLENICKSQYLLEKIL